MEEIQAAQTIPSHHTQRDTLLNGFSTPRRQVVRAQDLAPRIVPQGQSQIDRHTPFPIAILFAPLSLFFRLLAGSFRLVLRLFPFLSRVISPSSRRFRREHDTRSFSGQASIPQESALHFKQYLAEMIKATELPFVEGGYAQAYDAAKRESKVLIVIILSQDHDENLTFLRNVLASSETVSCLNAKSEDIVLWGGLIQQREAYEVSTALRSTQLPFTAIITPKMSSGSSPVMVVVSRISGATTSRNYVRSLQSVLDEQRRDLISLRKDRATKQATTNLRDEQNSAYERSLAADQEKRRIRREAEAAREEAEAQSSRREKQALRKQEESKRWRQWRAKSIFPEPGQSAPACRVSIRLADGTRVIRRFRPDCSMEELYAYVDCLDEVQHDQVKDHQDEEAATLRHEYSFRLVSPMPRTVHESSTSKTIGDVVGQSGNFIVEPLDEEV